MAFNPGGDLCLGFWRDIYEQGVAAFPANARVLEIGCAEADWIAPMKAERPDLHITGIDWRAVQRDAADALVRGDARVADFPREAFDAIVSVSAIEHVGLGAYDNDPRDPDGDICVMRNAYTWLKPGGWMYLDVPYGPYTVGTGHRTYDEDAVQQRLVGDFSVRHREILGHGRGDGPYVALVLQK